MSNIESKTRTENMKRSDIDLVQLLRQVPKTDRYVMVTIGKWTMVAIRAAVCVQGRRLGVRPKNRMLEYLFQPKWSFAPVLQPDGRIEPMTDVHEPPFEWHWLVFSTASASGRKVDAYDVEKWLREVDLAQSKATEEVEVTITAG